MTDLKLSWGGDLHLSPTGDLLIISDPELGTERVLRRLMTNPGDYIWHPDYGAGLGKFIGRAVETGVIEALVRDQLMLETAISQVPEPVIGVTSDSSGELIMQIRYADSATAEALNVVADVSRQI